MMTKVEPPALGDDLIARCASRTTTYDRENRFFDEDFQELREAGYLTMADGLPFKPDSSIRFSPLEGMSLVGHVRRPTCGGRRG
jgi:hypothetical protein